MTRYVFVGTYTQNFKEKTDRKEGIFSFVMDAEKGKFTQAGVTEAGSNPSFLAIHPSKRYLYAVNELVEGGVSSFSIDPKNGGLHFINRQTTRGVHPCHLNFDPTGKWLMVTNYSSGSLAVYPIQADGSLGEMTDFIQHQGKGPNQARQESAHAHSIQFDPDGKFAIAADLGIDRMMVYTLDGARGKLVPHSAPSAAMNPGSGPRHFAFSQDGHYIYVANELDSTVTACQWDGQAGKITPFQTLSTLPEGFKGESAVADIHFDKTYRRLYVSNRGHNSLAVYDVEPKSGRLTYRMNVSTGGEIPRNFGIDPSGNYLLAGNQNSDTVVVFKINQETGIPEATGTVLDIPSPVCILYMDL
jgi:6-phosphogluconolactonase